MIRKHPDILAIALLVVILAAGAQFAPLLGPVHDEAHQHIQLAMLEAQDEALRGIGEARIELIKAEGDLFREASTLRHELTRIPSCPLSR
jgi:hypothetical protein